MNLEDLRRAKNRERETDSLQELPDSFYADVADYIEERRAERAAAAAEAEDPFGSEPVTRLTDEIETAERVAESLYERRVGKVVKQASFAAAEMGTGEVSNLTAEEQDLYADLVERIQSNKQRVLDVVGGEDGAAATVAEAAAGDGGDGVDADGSVDAGSEGDGDTPTDAEHPDRADGGPERTTVRVTEDVGEIFGVDERTYALEAGDVVTLPDPNATPLLDNDAAEPLE